jgi:cytochrome c-type biogenesis protein
MNEKISVLIAFGAGLLSFLSPCVLPLIPSYFCVIGGASLSASSEKAEGFKPRLVAGTVSFILGFSVVFVAMSVIFAATFSLMGGISRWINVISGAVVIVLGLNIIFDFLSFLNYEKRLHFAKQPRGIAGAFAAGAAFGAGWTPCVGPVLAGILLLAAQSGGIPLAVLYLICYSAGLGLPFLLASIFFGAFVKTSVKLRPHLPLIRRISGALLVVIGALMVTGRYQALNAMAAKWQNSLLEKKAAAETVNNSLIQPVAAKDDSSAGKEARAIPPGVAAAFSAAGLPLAREGLDPVDFTLPLLEGGNQTLSALKGQVVFLNFWATWCGPCRMEMPSMEAVYRRLKDQGFTILAVNLGEKAAQVSGFMKDNKLTFPVALDESGRTGGQYGAQAIPTTYILDRRGLIISRMVGALDWNEEKIIRAFETLCNER